MSTQIIVKNRAPNWPAMVESKKKPKSCPEMTSTTTSIWMKSRMMKNQIDNKSQNNESNNSRDKIFANKTYLVKQCENCKVLYSNFHNCK